MVLLALAQLGKDPVLDRPVMVQLGRAEKSQEARVQHTVALRLEVRIDDGNAFVVREIFQRLPLGPLPIGEMLVIIDDHAALWTDVGTVRPGGCEQTRKAIDPGLIDEVLDLLWKGHETSIFWVNTARAGRTGI